jgi:deoxyribonuclease V
MLTPKALSKIKEKQLSISAKLNLCCVGSEFSTICGISVIFREKVEYGVGVLYQFTLKKGLGEEIACVKEVKKNSLPYIPGLLILKEGSLVISLIKKLSPSLVLLNSQGIAHPRGLGLASHIGYILKVPTIGVTKKLLVGKYKFIKKERGNYSYIEFNNQIVGAVVCTKTNTNPLFISPGYLIDIPTSIEVILKTSKYRTPTPLREARMRARLWASMGG